MGNLFQTGQVRLHAGGYSNFKIDCDALTDEDIRSISLQLTRRLPKYSAVEGIPRGGLRLAEAMGNFVTPGNYPLLIVDDVFTTGASMEEHRGFRVNVIGAVIFARSEPPAWITPLFRMEE